MNKISISVTYNCDGKVQVHLDREIEAALKTKGFERYASGISTITGERDLAFEKEFSIIDEHDLP